MQPLDEQSGSGKTPSRWQRYRPVGLRILGMILAAGLLLFFSRIAASTPCWLVFVLVGLIAWPIWQYRTEYLLFRRRLVLDAAAQENSRIRTMLWRGSISKVVQTVVSMLLAWLLLALASAVSPLHWYVLAADGVVLALLAGPVTRHLEGDIKTRHLGVIARRWPLFLLNSCVLALGIMALDFFIVGTADTRHLMWHEVAEQAFTTVQDEAGCIVWGVSAGGLTAVEALAWHFSELIIPQLPDLSVKIIAWSFFLLRAITMAWLYTALLLGINVLLEKRDARRKASGTEGTISRAFILTIIVLAVLYYHASLKLSKVDPFVLEQGVGNVAELINPCKPSAASRDRLIARLDESVDSERKMAMDEVDARIDQGLEHLFHTIENGVDRYLDWYFTVIGEYQRLATAFTGDVVATMQDKLEEYLFEASDFDFQLGELDRKAERLSADRFAALLPKIGAELENVPCDTGRIDMSSLMDLDRDNVRASIAATSGIGAGVVASKVLANKTTAAVIGKIAAKKSFQTGAALATKTLAKKGASSALSAGLGTTLCAPVGPVAILCGVTAGLVTWLVVDKALIELDESLNRDEMRADIMAVLAEQQVELGIQLKQKHHARIDQRAARVNDAIGKSFVPYDDGLGY